MVADRDPLPEYVDANQHGDEADPGKEIGNERHQAEKVDNQNGPKVKPIYGKRLNGFGNGQRHRGHAPLLKKGLIQS